MLVIRKGNILVIMFFVCHIDYKVSLRILRGEIDLSDYFDVSFDVVYVQP